MSTKPQLSKEQIKFLLDTVFRDEDPAIATKLLTSGKCIVPYLGHSNRQNRELLSLVKSSAYPDSVNCSILTVDLEVFLSSPYVLNILSARSAEIARKVEAYRSQQELVDDMLTQGCSIRDTRRKESEVLV